VLGETLKLILDVAQRPIIVDDSLTLFRGHRGSHGFVLVVCKLRVGAVGAVVVSTISSLGACRN
jgi:hypothetical protein